MVPLQGRPGWGNNYEIPSSDGSMAPTPGAGGWDQWFGSKVDANGGDTSTTNVVPTASSGAPRSLAAWLRDYPSPLAETPNWLALSTGQIDATSAINAALAKGSCYLPPGTTFQFSGTLTPMAGEGLIGPGPGSVQLIYTGASGVAISLQGDRAFAKGFALSTTQSVSTAVAIQMGAAGVNPDNQAVDGIGFVGFQTHIDVQSGQFWHISRTDQHNPSSYAIRVRNLYNADSGDGDITDCNLYADGTIGDTAVRWESGGGLKMAGTKVLQFAHAFVVAAADGIATSDITIDITNSFENQTSTAVVLGQAGPSNTGTVAHLKIEPQVSNGVLTVGAGMSDVVLGGIYNNVNTAIAISGGTNIVVLPELIVNTASVAGVSIADPATAVTVHDFRAYACAAKVVDSRTVGAGTVIRTDTRPISLPQSSSYTALYEVDVPTYRGARIVVQVEGTLATVGVVNTLLDVMVSNTGSGVASPVTVSNVQGGSAAVDIQFDTTTVAGAVRIGVRPDPGVGGGTLTGSVSIRVEGKSAYFKVL